MKTRKSLNWLVACGLVSVTALATTANAQTVTAGQATVRFVSGSVQYTTPDGSTQPLRKDVVLIAGTTIQTDTETNSYADLAINERTSTIRVQSGTTMKIDKMQRIGGADGDFQTGLNLMEGAILGSVKKLSKASLFDIKVPNGVAGIRGTDVHISVKKLPNNKFEVTFTSVNGTVYASSTVEGKLEAEAHVLQTGDSWTPGGAVVQVDIADWARLIVGMVGGEGGFEPPIAGANPFNPEKPVSPGTPRPRR